jgi:hypothetical protein
MKIYSQSILNFTNLLLEYSREIIGLETSAIMRRTRFEYAGFTFPISIIAFEDDRQKKTQTLGFFCHETYSIFINYFLCKNMNAFDLKNLLRHEIAHYLTFIDFGSSVSPHGKEFHQICEKFNWSEQVSKASIELMDIATDKTIQTQAKIEKLLNLSASSNIHEASLALEKARTLMLESGLKVSIIEIESEAVYYVKTLKTYKRQSPKLKAIYLILDAMGLGVVMSSSTNEIRLESFGAKEKVGQSQDIFNYIESTLEQLVTKEKIKGIRSRNSFYLGFSRAVKSKIQESNYSDIYQALIKQNQKELQIARDLIYPRLVTSTYSHSKDYDAFNKGHQHGKEFNTKFEKHHYLSN